MKEPKTLLCSLPVVSLLTIQDVPNGTIWTLPHMLQVKFLHTSFICQSTPVYEFLSMHNSNENPALKDSISNVYAAFPNKFIYLYLG